MASNPAYKNIIVTKIDNPGGLKVGQIQFNRPDVLNALNIELMGELLGALEQFDKETEIGCIIITGSAKAFAAGADIKEMATQGAIDMHIRDQFAVWDKIRKIKKPIIAATSGYVLGGGCELSMTCDMIVAAESTRFGQPEIKIGIIPGAGGTQRLTRAIGKARAMEMILTGRMYSAREMFEAGLVTRIADDEIYLEEAQALAKEIAAMPPIAVQMAKDAILKAFDTTVEGGLEYERKAFYLLFASEDMKEGMNAFIEKRKPEWKGK
ncbi:MAG: enoyl-CoA hydratase-related protein [Chlorobi bacterium]|nr:enoyl-CoA hydratase-related protein [Chlorobiota bacterium]MCI0716018.1 enoyl-CoA hydratase-related protein [Chlorobiota bacterium]